MRLSTLQFSALLLFHYSIRLMACQGISFMNDLKTKMLTNLGLTDNSSLNRFDIVWPEIINRPSRKKRSQGKWPFEFNATSDIFYRMNMFGKLTSMFLRLSNVTSERFQTVVISPSGLPYVVQIPDASLRCHYSGVMRSCNETCTIGKAAVSRCNGGLQGLFKLDGQDLLLQPLSPQEPWNNDVSSGLGPHLVKWLFPSRVSWDDPNERNWDSWDYSLSGWQQLNALREIYGFTFTDSELFMPWGTPTATSDNSEWNTVVVEIAVLVDTAMANLLSRQFETNQQQINHILSVFNAAQAVFDHPSFGDIRLRLQVKRVTIDQTGKVFKGGGDANMYMSDVCEYQRQLVTSSGGALDWNILAAFTAVDIFALTADVIREKTYSDVNSLNGRVYGVAGASFTGGACKMFRNCLVVEFPDRMESVDTLAHEIAHTVGVNHDGSGNKCDATGANGTQNIVHVQTVALQLLRSRDKRGAFSPGSPPMELNYTIDMFGGTYKLFLLQSVVAANDQIDTIHIAKDGTTTRIPLAYSQAHCHYQGTVKTCHPSGTCYEGKAAMSRFAHGLRGMMKIGGEDILIEPLPETLLAKRMRFSNVHIARKKISDDEDEDEVEAFDLLNRLADSLRLAETLLDLRPLLHPPKAINVEVGVFVDSPMVKKLRDIYPDPKDQITLILAAYNAVNLLYADSSLGRIKVNMLVKRVHLDESNSMPKNDKVTEYLNDLCQRYQNEVLHKLKIKKDWDLSTALTGLDVYADAADVTRDPAYRKLKGSANKIFTVSGVSYGGGMCSNQKNCMVAEFSLLFGNIETIAHEAGHTLGMYHDGSGNFCDRKGNKIMSVQRPRRQRSGWSSCSSESLFEFIVSGHASCLLI